MDKAQAVSPPTWISGPRLRQRWAMSNSSFYQRLKAGAIPKPEYPFSEFKPFWRMDVIVQFEEARKASKGGA